MDKKVQNEIKKNLKGAVSSLNKLNLKKKDQDAVLDLLSVVTRLAYSYGYFRAATPELGLGDWLLETQPVAKKDKKALSSIFKK